jgi:hypothetical protein
LPWFYGCLMFLGSFILFPVSVSEKDEVA